MVAGGLAGVLVWAAVPASSGRFVEPDQAAPVRAAVTTTAAYRIAKLPPTASIAAPLPARARPASPGGTGRRCQKWALVQPLVPRVGPLPVESPLRRVAERADLPYPVGRRGEERRVPSQAGHHPVEDRHVGQHPAIDRGEGFQNVGRS